MSNYTKTVDFSAKDALSTGDPSKVVKGTEINTELVNVASAISSKADSASPAFSGTASGALSFPDNVIAVVGSADATKKVVLEVDGLTTGTIRTVTVPDASGIWAYTTETDGSIQLAPMFIQGLTISNNAGDATNDLDIAAGACRDATNAHNMVLTALTKQSDVAWAVGTNQGGLDTGAVGNNDYYIWAIKRADTGVKDILFSLSSTAPTMPANYGFKRLIGWFKRVAGAIVAFKTYETEGGGIEYSWDVPTLDVNLANTLTTSRRTDAVKVPLNFSVIANINVRVLDATTSQSAWICCPDQTDAAPSTTAAPLGTVESSSVAPQGGATFNLRVRTSSAGLIAARSTLSTVDFYLVSTMGFTWARRN